MTSAELTRVVDAMTGRPWAADYHHCIESPSQEGNPERATRMTVTILGSNGDENERAIIALANHADALVDLVRACERLLRSRSKSPPADPEWFDRRFVEMEAALAKVHAVGKETA